MDKLPKKHSVVIIDDHPVMRESLAAHFAAAGIWEVPKTAATLEEARAIFVEEIPELVILDIQLEETWGLDLIPWLRSNAELRPNAELHPNAELRQNAAVFPAIVIYSNFNDYAHVSAALGMGVRSYVLKTRNKAELEAVCLAALRGETHIDRAAEMIMKNIADAKSLLTKREGEILTLVKQGLSNKQISARLGISRRTVENILSCVYDKTGIPSRLELQKL
ncbi:DNA-binding response regulator [Spirochaetia bacterium]|nr:DNA-binding response regulator [Spirochaetia bacterium]